MYSVSGRNSDASDAFLLHRDALRRLARALDVHSADDLLHETWIQSATHAPPDDVAPGPWLRGVLRNLWRMDRRAGVRRAGRERRAPCTPEAELAPDVVLEQRERLEQLREMLAELRPDLRSIVEMRYFEGLSAAEIARREGIPPGTVRRRLKSGMDQLRARGRDSLRSLTPLAVWPDSPTAGLTSLGKAAAVKTSTKVAIAAVVAVAFAGGGLTGHALGTKDASTRVTQSQEQLRGAMENDDRPRVHVAPNGRLDPANDDHVQALEAKIAELEGELTVLRTRLSINEAGNPLTRTFFNLTDEEKAALVQNCEIRADMPRQLSDELALDLDLSDAESAAWRRAWDEYERARQAQLVALWEKLTGDRLPRVDLMAIPPEQLNQIRARANPNLLRTLAEERAGMRPPPTDAELSALPPADQWARLNARQGDDFEHSLAKELGPERARELRSATDGWTGGRMHREGCAEDAG
jgi:RNA polymerase sigma-70 factor (ECF subfamily)